MQAEDSAPAADTQPEGGGGMKSAAMYSAF
jgi:hypothetical protein